MEIAASSLGMGVNIPNIKRVVIFEVPENIWSYPQAVERGERDCPDVLSIMFYCAYHLCHCDPIMRAFGKNKVNVGMCIGVRAPLDLGGGGGGDLIARKKLHHARKHVLYKRNQIAVKTKTFTILTSNERIVIPKLQLNPDFSSLHGKRNIGLTNRIFREIWGN